MFHSQILHNFTAHNTASTNLHRQSYRFRRMNRGGGRNQRGYSTLRGRSSRYAGRSSYRHSPTGANGSSNNYPVGSKDRSSHSGWQNSEWKPLSSISKNSEQEPLHDGKDRPPDMGNLQQGQNSPEAVSSSSKQPDCFFASDSTNEKDPHSLAAQPDSEDRYLDAKRIQIVETPGEGAGNGKIREDHFRRMNRGGGRNHGGYSTFRGRSSRSAGRSSYHHPPTGANGSSNNYPVGSKDRSSHSGWQNSEWKSLSSISKNSEHEPLHDGKDRPPDMGNLQQGQNSPEAVSSSSKQPDCFFASDSTNEKDPHSLASQPDSEDSYLDAKRIQTVETPGDGAGNGKTLHHELLCKVDSGCMHDDCQLHPKSCVNERCSQSNVPQYGQASPGDPAGNRNSVQSEYSAIDGPFDICQTKTGTLVMLKPSLLQRNREKRNELNRSNEGQKGRVLRSGMVLLKGYLSITDQVEIVKICRKCGLGSGGFYQPGYRDGAKLHLKMMCLGKNWDPEKGEYGEFRRSDGAKPPAIPDQFNEFVKKAIQDSHVSIGEDDVEKILPWMSPNICIVNFYTTSGRLGLHKDQDESEDSLRKRLPVVSFSIGDSAEFLYGNERDVDKADKIELESGDVLIFGGQSRHIFHGVSAIRPDTAPKTLLEKSNLRPGRLNLTFRQY